MMDTFSITILYFKYFKLIFEVFLKTLSKPIIPTFHIKSMSNVYSIYPFIEFKYLISSQMLCV